MSKVDQFMISWQLDCWGDPYYNTEFILVQVKKILPHKELILGLTPDNYFKPDSNYHSAHVQLPAFMYIVSIIDFTNYGTYIVTDTFLLGTYSYIFVMLKEKKNNARMTMIHGLLC